MNPTPSLRTYPLEMPTPGRFYHRTAARLGWHPAAAALVTLGWLTAPHITVRDTSGPAAPRTSFFIAPRPGTGREFAIKAAEKLVARAIPHGKQSLARTEPAHPFLAALAAIDNLVTLREWQRTGGPVPLAYHLSHPEAPQPSPWLTLFLHGEKIPPCAPPRAELRPWIPGHPLTHTLTDAPACAALIACGFIPWPEPLPVLVPGTGTETTGLGFSAQSATLPAFTLTDALAAAREILRADAAPGNGAGTLAKPITLPGYPPDEHPFLYAFRAARNVPALHGMAVRAAANPVRQFVNRSHSKRTALVTDHLLHPGQNALARRELEKHLNRRF